MSHDRYMLICDEAHYMQNLQSKRTKATLALAEGALALVLATGASRQGEHCHNFPRPFSITWRTPIGTQND